jgi:plasmid stabilization system protein ParE
MNEYRLTDPAKRDLREIWAWIAKDSERNADRFLAQLLERFAKLAANPELGSECEHLGPGLRRFPFKRRVVYYRAETPLLIVRVIHGARDQEAEMGATGGD